MRITTFLLLVLSDWCFAAGAGRPNIILIMVDDMGFSDIGCYGGEIETPNIDALAAGGVRFSQFYNSGRCCPTRATLLTGLPPHRVGIGHMTETPEREKPKEPAAYRGFLNRDCMTIAEALKATGYNTLMTGKWHLGHHGKDRRPLARGFTQFYGCISGATNFFNPQPPRGVLLGDAPDAKLASTTDRRYYTTDAFTDYARLFIEHHVDWESESPFFLYLAYTAPHWPIQAHEKDIAKYRGKYKIGWDKLRERRYRRQIELGLIDPKWKLSPRDEQVPPWDSLNAQKQDEMDLKMAIYAAMIDRVDQNIGKLVADLKKRGLFENTLIMFLSDNGACAEGGILGRGEFYDIEKRNAQASNAYGRAWANASSTPFRLYKHFAHEGGAATPFFMHWPKRIKPREDWYTAPAQLFDIMPTLLELAGAPYPEDMPKLEGISLSPAFDGKPLERSKPIFIEHENNRSPRSRRRSGSDRFARRGGGGGPHRGVEG